jgi:hypothetical protein
MTGAAPVVMRWVAAVVVSGVAAALGLFFVTSWGVPQYGYLGPLCAVRDIAQPGFNPWTGEPHGRIFECAQLFDEAGSPIKRVTSEAPIELVDRQAVPLPAGFAVGALIAVVWLTVNGVTAGRTAMPRARTRTHPLP